MNEVSLFSDLLGVAECFPAPQGIVCPGQWSAKYVEGAKAAIAVLASDQQGDVAKFNIHICILVLSVGC